MRNSPSLTRRMIVSRRSGPTFLRMNAAAPARIAWKSASSSSSEARMMIPVAGRSRLMRCVASIPPGAGSERSIRMIAGSVSRAASWAARPSSASPTISKSGSRSRIARIPTRTRAWSSTIRIRIRSPTARRSGPPRRRSGPPYDIDSLPPHDPDGNGEPDDRALGRAGSHVEVRADQLRAVAHELEPEAAALAGAYGVDVEAVAIVCHLQRPLVVLDPGAHVHHVCLGVSTNVLERLLHDAEDHDLSLVGELAGGSRKIGLDRRTGERTHRCHAVLDGSVEPELGEEWRPELRDERPHVVQLATQALAQEANLRADGSRVSVENPLDVVSLEDRVHERLGRAVVDLLGEPDALRLARLDQPHPEVVGQVRRRWVRLERGVASFEEEPRALQSADGQLQSREFRPTLTELTRRERNGAPKLAGTRRLAGACAVVRPAERIELLAVQLVVLRVPRSEVCVIRLAVLLSQRAQRVGRIAESGLGLRVHAIEAA